MLDRNSTNPVTGEKFSQAEWNAFNESGMNKAVVKPKKVAAKKSGLGLDRKKMSSSESMLREFEKNGKKKTGNHMITDAVKAAF